MVIFISWRANLLREKATQATCVVTQRGTRPADHCDQTTPCTGEDTGVDAEGSQQWFPLGPAHWPLGLSVFLWGSKPQAPVFDPGYSLWPRGYDLDLSVKEEPEATSSPQINQEGVNGTRAGGAPKGKEKQVTFWWLLLSVTCDRSLYSESSREGGSWRGWLVVKSLSSGFRFQHKYRFGG